MNVIKAWLLKIARIFYRLLIKLAKPFLPYIKRYVTAYRDRKFNAQYNAYALCNERICFVEAELSTQPLISIVVATFNTDNRHLHEMIYSVVNQHYQNWELLLVNASSELSARSRVEAATNIDTRIKIIHLPSNEGIAGNTNHGIKAAKGEFLAFLDHDDLLHPCALHCVVESLRNSHAEIIYTDEDKVSDQSDNFYNPLCKPRFSPDLLRNVNYLNHLTVIKRSLVEKVGGLRKEFDGAQDYDLLLRVIDQSDPIICHVPRVLYHWRAAETSTASDISTKHYIFRAGTKALEQHLIRTRRKGTVQPLPNKPGFYKIAYKIPEKITLVIGPVDGMYQSISQDWLKRLCAKLSPKKFQLIVGDWLPKDFLKDFDVKTIEQGAGFWKAATEAATGEAVIVLQEAVAFKTEADVLELASLIQAGEHTIASPVTVDSTNHILDSGLVQTSEGQQMLFLGHGHGRSTFAGPTDWIRNVDSLSFKTFALSRQNFKHYFGEAKHKTIKSIQAGTTAQYLIWGLASVSYNGPFHSQLDDGYLSPLLMQPSLRVSLKQAMWTGTRENDE